MPRPLRLAMGALIGIAFGVVAMLSLELRDELHALLEEPVDSLQWNVTQLELDVVRLEAAARVALVQPDADLTELRWRFDLFYNRAGTVNQGRMFTRLGLAETVRPLKERMQAFLDATTPLIDGPDDRLRAALPQITASIGDLRQDMRVMAVRVIDANAAQEDARRTGLAEILRMIAVAAVALVVLLLALLFLVLALNRQAERRTREVQRITSRLEATVDTSLDAVIVAGMDGRVIDFNRAAERIFGYDRAEALGQALSALIVPPRHRAAHEAGMTRMRTTGEKHVVDAGRIRITAVRKSGEEFPVELSIASNDSPEGMIFIAFLRDISDAQKAEAALVAARDEARAAEQTKTNFIAVMSHEMRTPLNGVIGALDIIGRTTLDERQARFLDLARGSAAHLLRHVNDVLDISRIDAGFAAVADDRFDLAALIATRVDPLRPAAAARNTRLVTHILSDLPPLRGDPFRLGQIVQNFVMNAIKFTEEGRITVEVELQRRSGDQVEIEVRVTDTGIGIAEADQERIFEDFVMVDPSYGRSGEGTGLGLAIARRLARAMGGEIGVESVLGEGSCFWLRLPLHLAERPDQPRPAGAGQPQAKRAEALDVLVVEDNETNRVVLQEMLHYLGHRVTLAADGGEGVERARAQTFDVILMDLSMPKMDGWAAIAAIRSSGASRHGRILAVTAHTRPDRDPRYAEAGFDGWLTKPLSINALVAALRPDSARRGGPPGDAPLQDAAEPLLDAERLAELDHIADRQALRGILAGFRARMDQIVQAITAAAPEPQLPALATLCHEGAGAAAVIGATRLHKRLAALEAASLKEDRAAVQAAAAGLGAVWAETCRALDAIPASADP